MPKRIPRDPEKEARWAAARRMLQERIDHNERLLREAGPETSADVSESAG